MKRLAIPILTILTLLMAATVASAATITPIKLYKPIPPPKSATPKPVVFLHATGPVPYQNPTTKAQLAADQKAIVAAKKHTDVTVSIAWGIYINWNHDEVYGFLLKDVGHSAEALAASVCAAAIFINPIVAVGCGIVVATYSAIVQNEFIDANHQVTKDWWVIDTTPWITPWPTGHYTGVQLDFNYFLEPIGMNLVTPSCPC